MAYKTVTYTASVTAVDIPTMQSMSLKDYRQYIRHGLISLDHHEVLRSEPADYPLACNQEQMAALLEYLTEISPRVGP